MRAIVLFGLLYLGLVTAAVNSGCAWLRSTADDAKSSIIDCKDGELANLKVIAPVVLAGAVASGDWKSVETAAIASGYRFGGCLLAELHALLPKPNGFVGIPTPAELSLINLREATATNYTYVTEAGRL